MYPGQIPMPSMTALNGSGVAALGGSRPAGRPARVQPTALQPANVSAGFTLPDVKPELLQHVHQQYLKQGSLPPKLQPRAAGILEQRRHKAIQRGWQAHYQQATLRKAP